MAQKRLASWEIHRKIFEERGGSQARTNSDLDKFIESQAVTRGLQVGRAEREFARRAF